MGQAFAFPSLSPSSVGRGGVRPHADSGVVLLELRQAVDDAKPQVIPKLDLHHLGGEVFPDLSNFLRAELQLSPATFDEVVDQQGRQVLRVLITGVAA